jgi:acetyl-CoA carboxylase carboxyl transferase subunit beta
MWFKKKVKAKPEEKLKLPDGLWVKCETCGEILYRKELEKNLWICPKCNFHFRINHHNYISLLFDDAKLEEKDENLEPLDPLDFPEYKKKQKIAQEKTGMKEGAVYGLASIGDISVVFAAMDFAFMGGSMGSVIGEKIARATRTACKKELPLIILSASGGARMQEGILSLMQMAKTSAELALLAQKKIPYISILTHPTTAGVMASYASLGDIIITEPGALLGFTGARVAAQTIGEKFPPKELRNTLIKILRIIWKHGKAPAK